MSDFLTRLAGRVLGTEPVARPLVLSTFTPAAEPERTEAFAEPVESRRGNEMDEAEPEVKSEARPDNFATLPQISATIPRQDPLLDAVARPNAKTEPAAPIRLRARSTPAPAPIQRTNPKVLLPNSVPQRDAVRTPQTAAMEVAQSIPVSPPSPPSERPSPQIPPIPTPQIAPEQPQVIRVTIGRVDVRAEFPAPATPSATRRSMAPTLSLDDYLKERNEGKR
jgi:hypothetical protein